MFIPISQVFLAFLTRLEELNNLTDQPIFLTSAIHALQIMDCYFEVPNLGQLRTFENNPHHWFETDLLQLKQLLHQFFHNITLNDQTIPQIHIYCLFHRKVFRFNYQLM